MPPKLEAEMDRWEAALEDAAMQRGTPTREGLAFDEETGELSDATAWELAGDD